MALVDARRRRVDDDEHLRREIFGLAVEDHARHVDRRRFVRALVHVELERGEAVLAVDDEELPLRRLEVARRFGGRPEGQRLVREQQHGPGNRRLVDRRLVEVLDRPHLRLRHLALEGGVGPLDPRDERRDLVVLGRRLGGDLLALAVEPTDEPDLLEQLVGRVGDEVVDAVFLTDLSGEHFFPGISRGVTMRDAGDNRKFGGGAGAAAVPGPLPPKKIKIIKTKKHQN